MATAGTGQGASKGSGADIWRDAWGIPHIRAATSAEAFRALGYAHARDRLWQMEALLRRGIGRYAEWVGESAVKGDVLSRRLGVEAASRRDHAALAPATHAMLDAYAEGVNAFIATGHRPLEYRLLGVEPGRWEPWQSIAVMRQVGLLMGSVWWKLWRAASLPVVGPEGLTRLRFEDGGDELLCAPAGLETGPYRAALEALKPGLDALMAEAAPDIVGGGSNNWALSPSRTATGRPLLAGDPHRQLEMPSMYAQTHLACDAFDIIGLTVPGVPGFPHFAHNGKVAWCVTHAWVDIHDLYVERFRNDGAEVLFKDAWEPAERRRERIAVKGGADVEIEVTVTRHGPVLVGDPAAGAAIALRSAQFTELDTSFDCLPRMLGADSVRALYDATRGWGMIDHNLVAADTKGSIGYRVRAKIPRRTPANGWLPVPGWTGAHEWDGMIDWDDLPEVIDPAEGALVTANNRVARNDPHYLATDAMPPHRAHRVWQRLAELDKATVDDMADVLRDVQSIPAAEFAKRLSTVKAEGAAETLRRLIADWDGRMEAGSVAPTAYTAFRHELTRVAVRHSGLDAVRQSPYAQVPPGTNPDNQLFWTLPGLLRAGDETLLNGATWDALILEALDALKDRELKPWGAAHQPFLGHLLAGVFPQHAGELNRLSAPVAGDNDCVFATGALPAYGARAVYSALSRYVFDVGAWENSRWIAFHGASGEPDSPWYLNQNAAWAAGEMVPMLYDWRKIAAEAADHLSLPGGTA